MAHELDAACVRTMCFRKDVIMFGEDGTDDWNVAKGAWAKTVELLAPIVAVAAANELPAVVETGNNSKISSAWLAALKNGDNHNQASIKSTKVGP